MWDDGGTLRCTRGPAWTNDTTRGYTLTLTNGILLNTSTITNGPAALRGTYVGTIRSDSSSQINDSAARRHVWNTYNRVLRKMKAVDTTNSWTYASATLRQANGSTNNQLNYVCGLAEDIVEATAISYHVENTTVGNGHVIGIGVDSTSANSADIFEGCAAQSSAFPQQAAAFYKGIPGVGAHYLAWLEASIGSVTVTSYGDNGGSNIQSGIIGSVFA